MAKKEVAASEVATKKETTSAKSSVQAAREALESYCKTNKLKVGKTHSKNEGWVSLNKKLEKALEEQKAANSSNKATKAKAPKGEGKGLSGRATTYDYPADCITNADKKKYRTQQRAKKAQEEKGTKPKEEKVEKTKKAEAPAKEVKTPKTDSASATVKTAKKPKPKND